MPVRVLGEEMPAAILAPLAVARSVLLKLADLVGALRHLHVASGHKVNAFTGPADQVRHDSQWQ